MESWLKLFLILSFLKLHLICDGKTNIKKVIRILKLENCVEDDSVKLKLTNVSIITHGLDNQVINVDLTVTTISSEPQTVLRVLKCQSLSRDSCEQLWKLKYNICDKLKDDSPFFALAYRNFQPELKCPVHPGLYKVVNVTVPSESFMPFFKGLPGILDHYWGFEMGYPNEDNDGEHGCWFVLSKVYQMKIKN